MVTSLIQYILKGNPSNLTNKYTSGCIVFLTIRYRLIQELEI